ncbi:sugar phosphate isomerase/epimerase [Anaerolentibacter hominis]|uniref:sugar phosphate isomerase/epimerase family protein n=1 Tax=Anaerolentibacter hominis TaxID=3079009 RepID=UPI0031B830BE
MKYGVHRWTWADDFNRIPLETFLEQARSTGAEAAEFKIPDAALQQNKTRAREIRQTAENLGLTLLCNAGAPKGLDMCSADPYLQKYAREHLLRVIQGAELIGVRKVSGILHSNWPARYDDQVITPEEKAERTKRSIENIRMVMPVAEECGVQLNFEIVNRFEHYVLNTVEEGISFCEQVDSKCCGLLLDVFHMNIEEDSIPEAIRRAKGHIGHFHVSESNRKVPYHTDKINWPEIGRALRDVGYDDTVVLEAALIFDGSDTYCMRMWRNLIPDTSLEARLQMLREGIGYMKGIMKSEE